MRAILRTTTKMEAEGLDALLMDKDWWPSLMQDHPEVIAKKNEILDHVSAVDRALAEGTYEYTIYDRGTKSWGLSIHLQNMVLHFG